MTDEELDEVRAEEAWNIIKRNEDQDVALIAARLAREGWTPPVAVDPDLAEAREISGSKFYGNLQAVALDAIKRGRELERAEAKPGMVWVKHDGSSESPVFIADYVWIKNKIGTCVCHTSSVGWSHVTHYAIISQPEEK